MTKEYKAGYEMELDFQGQCINYGLKGSTGTVGTGRIIQRIISFNHRANIEYIMYKKNNNN